MPTMPIVLLSGKEKLQYQEYFNHLAPQNSFPSMTRVRQLIWEDSYVPLAHCHQLWHLIESSQRGTQTHLMDQNTFNCMCRLIALCQSSFQLQLFHGQAPQFQFNLHDIRQEVQPHARFHSLPYQSVALKRVLDHGTLERYEKLYESLLHKFQARQLTQDQALALYRDSNLPHQVLAQIVQLCDVTGTHSVTAQQFAVGMQMIEYLLRYQQVDYSQMLPTRLYPELFPSAIEVTVKQEDFSVKQLSMSPTSPPPQAHDADIDEDVLSQALAKYPELSQAGGLGVVSDKEQPIYLRKSVVANPSDIVGSVTHAAVVNTLAVASPSQLPVASGVPSERAAGKPNKSQEMKAKRDKLAQQLYEAQRARDELQTMVDQDAARMRDCVQVLEEYRTRLQQYIAAGK